MQAWQLKSWTALRNADQAAYDKGLERAKERKAFLQAEIKQFDALTLRKMEREEIMRWVLRWLLGPGFDIMPANLQALFQPYPDPTKTTPGQSQWAYPDVSKLGITLPGGIRRHGTLSLLAGIALVTGKVPALVKDRHRSSEFIEFLQLLDSAYTALIASKIILENHSAHTSKKAWLFTQPAYQAAFSSLQDQVLQDQVWTTGSGLMSSMAAKIRSASSCLEQLGCVGTRSAPAWRRSLRRD